MRMNKNAVLARLCIVLISLAALAESSGKAVVRVPVANMFSSASADAEVVSQAIYTSEVEVLEQSENFSLVRTADGYSGWIRSDSLQSPPHFFENATFGQVSSLSANLYREPDVTKHAPVLTLPFEAKLEIIPQNPENADYFRVRLLDGQDAWIDRAEVDVSPHTLNIKESIQLAKRFLGVTYTWGGRSSFGFDCSGFTQMLLRSRGIDMPRDADQQAAWKGADAVDRKHLRPGDLLFFGSSGERITHTGMYIGKGEFIHDTTYGRPGVKISRLKDAPWTKLLVSCRRVREQR